MMEIIDNIRKIYRFSTPCDELACYVEFFSESCMEQTSRLITSKTFAVTMFQSWTPTFWVNLGTPYYIETTKSTHFVNSDNDVLILRNSTVTRQVSSDDHIFTIKFFPGGLEAILGIDQTKLIDRIIPLNSIFPPAILADMKKSISYEERVKLVQEYFLSKVRKKSPKDYYIRFVIDAMNACKDENIHLNTSEVAEKMFVTSKTINRYFNNVVGVSPKKYFSVVRARTSLTEYVANPKQFDPSVFGYYDMSHFHKDIANFTGRKLSSFSF